ncbi:S41 family peptidase [Hymenobacter glacialis]|uniref:Tail specific protease domain-containing protein n=1 Tax=Hymenobacter glacialis TaxID=1908236 RepID=A0A1G1SRK5_9BACT|nr:S41 family peptidase [Hymenobacter glacialis]OGX81260.1 hypothetical protein BEN48_06595 [Hymenobacter glacialis]
MSAQTASKPPYDPTGRFAVPQLQADLAFLRRALEEAHPGLYWYTPKDSLDHYFDRTAAALTHEMGEAEYWPLLQRLVAKVHCGHTRVQHSPAYRTWSRQQPVYIFPFTVAIRQNRLFVAANQSTDPTLRPGTELLAIEGHPASEVLSRMRTFLSGDGYHYGFQDQQLEAGFFDNTYWSLYQAKPTYELLVQDSVGQQRRLTPQLQRPAAPAAKLPAGPPLTPEQTQARQLARLRSLTYPAGLPATAVLRISGFSYDELEDYRKYHASVFAELAQRKVQRLVIDLRGNTGGNNAIAIDVLKYLMKKDFALTASARATVFAPSFMPVGQDSDTAFDTTNVRRLPNGAFGFAAATAGKQQPYRQDYFRGKVVVVIDGGTFSAASNFAASLRAQRRITVVGQESGGAEAGANGGIISSITLPQTQLVLQLPHFRLLSACVRPQLGRGVRPDVEIIPTPRQLATRTDAVLVELPRILRGWR